MKRTATAVRSGAQRLRQFTESVIREQTRMAMEHKAINLAQGFPDFPCPPVLKKLANDALAADWNQYSITWGLPGLRQAIDAREFREDLYFRISTFRLRIQPLRERPLDIMPLVMQSLARHNESGVPYSVTAEAQQLLLKCWCSLMKS